LLGLTAISFSVPGDPPGLPSMAVANSHLKLRFKSGGSWPYYHMGKSPLRCPVSVKETHGHYSINPQSPCGQHFLAGKKNPQSQGDWGFLE